MIKKFLSFLFIFLSAAVLAGPTVRELEKRVRLLEEKAETLRGKDPDFADWIKEQASIHHSYRKAYQYDLVHAPDEAPMIFDEWQTLLERMEQEWEIFHDMPDLEARGLVNVREFGAKTDGENDDVPAIQKAIDFAVKNAKGGIFLPRGRYLLNRRKGWRAPTLRFHNIKNFKMKGEEGTVLVMNSPKTPHFDIRNCENLRFENFHITSLKPVYSTGVVIGHTKDDKGVIYRHDGGLSPLDPEITKSEMNFFRVSDAKLAEDGKTPLLYTGPRHLRRRILLFQDSVKHLKNDEYIAYPNHSRLWPLAPGEKTADVYKKGLRLINYARNHSGLFQLDHADRCRWKRISMERIGGVVIKGYLSDATFITDCVISAAPEEKLAVATCADFFYVRMPSLGGFISRNVVKNLGDDFFNIHSAVTPVLHQEGKRIYIPTQIWGAELRSKHIRHIDIVPNLGKKLVNTQKRFKVLSVEKVKIKHSSTYFDPQQARAEGISYARFRALGERKISTIQKEPVDVTVLKLELDRDPGALQCAEPFITRDEYAMIRDAKKMDLVHFPDLYGQGLVISNNYFADCIGRCWIMGSGSLLRNNTFNIRMERGLFGTWNSFLNNWAEAFFPRIVTYEGNKFRLPQDDTTFFLSQTKYDPGNPATWMRHFYLTDNMFLFDLTSPYYGVKGTLSRPALLDARGIADLEITNNTFLLSRPQGETRFLLKDISGKISNNQFLGQWKGDKIISNVQVESE